MTGREIMCKNSNRIKLDAYVKRPKTDHSGRWTSFATKNKLRLTDAQLLIRFFCFDTRNLDFSKFIEMLNQAINQIGRVSIRIFLSDRSFHLLRNHFKICFWLNTLD